MNGRVQKLFYQGARGCLVFGDISDDEGFDGAEEIINNVREETGLPNERPIPIFLVGNKADKLESREEVQLRT